MEENEYFLGIDTSNYKTSIAVVDKLGNAILDERKFLDVKKGERGIRQSEALFQHINNLPTLFDKLADYPELKNNIKAVSVSKTPRPLPGSYMPVFNAGYSIAKSLSSVLRIPLYEFSHQEGHIKAVKFHSSIGEIKRFIAFHFSGGTTEAILIDESQCCNTKYEIIGGSKDISYGQLLDRIGVSLGMRFPCGEAMDELICNSDTEFTIQKVPKIKVKNGYINLSGIETASQKLVNVSDKYNLVKSIFTRITESIEEMTKQLANIYGVRDFIYSGGVASSKFIKDNLKSEYNIYFGEPNLSTDNAVGIALLGRMKYGTETYNGNTIK